MYRQQTFSDLSYSIWDSGKEVNIVFLNHFHINKKIHVQCTVKDLLKTWRTVSCGMV
jgi:hypothetical protein